MKICLGQVDIVWENPAANRLELEKLALAASENGCELLILPELFASGFSMKPEKFAEPLDGPTAKAMANAAAGANISIIGGLALTDSPSALPTNSALHFNSSGKLLARFDKLHPFSLANEAEVYRPGSRSPVSSVNTLRLSTLICYDLRFPEVFREIAMDVDLFIVIANWPATRAAHWEALLKARAIENLAYVVGVNRVGLGGNKVSYEGASLAFDPWGEELGRAGASEELLVVEIDPDVVGSIRRRFPFLKDRRTNTPQ